jgi:hypothetical protein
MRLQLMVQVQVLLRNLVQQLRTMRELQQVFRNLEMER